MSSSCASLLLYTLGITATGMDFTTSLVLGSSCKLVALGILGSNLGLSDMSGSRVTSDHLTSWTCLHLPAGTNVATGEFFPKLETV